MFKKIFFYPVFCFVIFSVCGCIPLVVGAAAGAVGGYAASRDTVQAETDKPYDLLWASALAIMKHRGTIRQDNQSDGSIEAVEGSSLVWIKLIRITDSTTTIKVSARKHHFPNIALAQDIFVKIMEEVK